MKRDVPEFRLTTPYGEGVRRTVAWMDQHKPASAPDDDALEDKLIAAWERFTRDSARAFGPAK